MYRRQMVIGISILVFALLATGCDDYANYTPNAVELTQIAELPDDYPDKPAIQGTAMARYETARIAEADAQKAALAREALVATEQAAQYQAAQQYIALTAEANERELAHRRGIELQAQQIAAQEASATQAAVATQQAIAVEVTQQAMTLEATRQAMEIQATGTAMAIDATSTMESIQATRTSQEALQEAEAVAADAAIAQLKRQDRIDAIVQPIRVVGWTLFLLAVLVLLVWSSIRLVQTLETRARVIRPDGSEGEPIYIPSKNQVVAPRRFATPVVNTTPGEENAPQLASPEMQDRTTARQQLANVALAQAQGAKQSRNILPTTPNRREAPGLVRVIGVGELSQAVGQGILPARLADTVEGQWHEVEEV